MNAASSIRRTQIVLLVLLTASVLAWILARPPVESSPVHVLRGVDAVGRARGLVTEVVHLARRLEEINSKTPLPVLTARRQFLSDLSEACGRLQQELRSIEPAWRPVAQADLLLADANTLVTLTLEQVPTRQVSVREAIATDGLDTDPDRTGMTSEAAAIIESRTAALLKASDELGQQTILTAVDASRTYAALLGIPIDALLFGALSLATLFAVMALQAATVRLRTSPDRALRNEMELLARTNQQYAIRRCHEHSAMLLKMAGNMLEDQKAARQVSP